MTAAHVPDSQQFDASSARSGADGLQALPAGTARSLRAAAAMQLRVVRGRAWVTLGTGPGGWLEASGDVMLHPGQSVCVQAGQHAVVEPLGGEGLHYQWRSAAAAAAAQTAAAGRAAPAPAAQPCGA